MSGAPISGPDDIDPSVLARAGWSVADLEWETLMEAAASDWRDGAVDSAAAQWAAALVIAREHFEPNDPRLATSLTNQALTLRGAGDTGVADRLLDEALLVWDSSGPWLDAMKPERHARSSLFHLRMEMRNRDTYRTNAWHRNRELAAAGRAATKACADGNAPVETGLTRWQAERPDGYSDRRKLLAAVALIAAGPANS